jgi:hypothetical protein
MQRQTEKSLYYFIYFIHNILFGIFVLLSFYSQTDQLGKERQNKRVLHNISNNKNNK